MIGKMASRATSSRTRPKEKRSFTLSHSSVAFLERLRKEKKATSTSQVLDELIDHLAMAAERGIVQRRAGVVEAGRD